MTAIDTLRMVVAELNAADIPYMVVGSNAGFVYGAERSTVDIDIVINPTHELLDRFLAAFEATDVYIGPSPHEALDLRDQFNLIDPSSGWKVDLIVPKDRAFDRSQLERRRKDTLMGIDVWVASAEDLILAKLEWAVMGGSDRQFQDVVRVLEVQAGELEESYLDRWADELGVRELLDRARAAAID